MKLHNTTVLPFPFFNSITIITSGFLLFWFFYALVRFLEAIHIRIAVLTQRLVPIRGINNYLVMLNEIVSQAHINSIVHTRQPNPPKPIKSLYLPFSLDNASILHGWDGKSSFEKTVELKVWVSGSCRAYVLLNFQAMKVKDLLKSNRGLTTPFEEFLKNIWSLSSQETCQTFVEYEVCKEVYRVGIINEGTHTITFQLPSYAREDPSASFGFLIVAESPVSASSALKSTWLRPAAKEEKSSNIELTSISSQYHNSDIESQLKTSDYNPIAVKRSSRDPSVAVSTVSETKSGGNIQSSTFVMESLGFALSVVSGSTLTPVPPAGSGTVKGMNSSFRTSSANSSPTKELSSPPIRTNLTLSECFISSKGGDTIYSAQEIFGWKGSRKAEAKIDENDENAASNSEANTEHTHDASNLDDECVVCLTEKKDIALLPCRHLCVCRHCLPRIDKCPVCRTNFDEYVAISSNEAATIQIPYHEKKA